MRRKVNKKQNEMLTLKCSSLSTALRAVKYALIFVLRTFFAPPFHIILLFHSTRRNACNDFFLYFFFHLVACCYLAYSTLGESSDRQSWYTTQHLWANKFPAIEIYCQKP